ncbi:hypothetical protein Hanom_Chr06g00493691 [Helianthus anomalus]
MQTIARHQQSYSINYKIGFNGITLLIRLTIRWLKFLLITQNQPHKRPNPSKNSTNQTDGTLSKQYV